MVVNEILAHNGDGHIDGGEEIADFIYELLQNRADVWIADYREKIKDTIFI